MPKNKVMIEIGVSAPDVVKRYRKLHLPTKNYKKN